MEDRTDLLMRQLLAAYATPKDEDLEHHIKSIKDAYSNSVLGIGGDDHLEQFDNYSFDNNTLNWYLWLALYNESWVFRRAIDKPSQDMIRPGISINGTQDYSKVYKTLDNLKPDLIDALKWSKLFGGSILVLLIQGIELDEMQNPIYDYYGKITEKSVIKAYVTDRWFGCSPSYNDIVSNLSNVDFGKPKYYDVMFADGTQYKIHHSWVLRFENRNAPNLVKTGMLQGWGYAEGQHIINELRRDDKLKSSIQSLVDKALIEVIKMPGMTGVFMGSENGSDEQLEKRLNMVNWSRNNNSLTFLDKDDEYQEHGFTGLAGLSDILDMNMKQIAAAVEMPNVLFGDLSNGFTSDDGALERYDSKILNDCDTFLRKPMYKLLRILFKIYGLDRKDISFVFNSTIVDKKNEKRLEDINNLLDTCQKMVDAKIMTTDQQVKTIEEFIDIGVINFQFGKINKDLVENKNREDIINGKSNNNSNEFDEDEDFGSMDLGSSELKRANKQEKTRAKEQENNPDMNTRETEKEASNEQKNENEPEQTLLKP